jgi:hypothetical protein
LFRCPIFEIGRRQRIAASPSLKRVHCAPIGAPPSEPTSIQLNTGRTRERVGLRREPGSPSAAAPGTGIGFAPETIARLAICRTLAFTESFMTAYLISLALAGLLVIVLWEGVS